MNRAIGANASAWASLQMPLSSGLILPCGTHRGRLDHDQARAAHCAASQMDKVPVGRQTVAARILAHGRDEDPVPKGQVT